MAFNIKNKYNYAEIVFLEKLFGLMTLSEITSLGFETKEAKTIAEIMSSMQSLGYNSMTKLILSKINEKRDILL